MSLSTCPKCWEDLCVCGEKYKHCTTEERGEIAAAALGVDKSELVLSLHSCRLLDRMFDKKDQEKK